MGWESLNAWREAWKEEALDDLPWRDEKGLSSVRRTLELFSQSKDYKYNVFIIFGQRQTLGKLLSYGMERISMKFSELIDSILN